MVLYVFGHASIRFLFHHARKSKFMPKFQMHDGSFVEGVNFKAAKDAYDLSKKTVKGPVVPVVAPQKATTVQAVITPVDNFIGRNKVNFGVGEVVNLSFTTNPVGATAASFGG